MPETLAPRRFANSQQQVARNAGEWCGQPARDGVERKFFHPSFKRN